MCARTCSSLAPRYLHTPCRWQGAPRPPPCRGGANYSHRRVKKPQPPLHHGPVAAALSSSPTLSSPGFSATTVAGATPSRCPARVDGLVVARRTQLEDDPRRASSRGRCWRRRSARSSRGSARRPARPRGLAATFCGLLIHAVRWDVAAGEQPGSASRGCPRRSIARSAAASTSASASSRFWKRFAARHDPQGRTTPGASTRLTPGRAPLGSSSYPARRGERGPRRSAHRRPACRRSGPPAM